MKNETIRLVEEFHSTFGHPILNKPEIPVEKRARLRLSLILEELNELAYASGEGTWFEEEMLRTILKSRQQAPAEKSIEQAMDAFADIQYVVSGSILEYGLQNCFDTNYAEVHRSNMSKACDTEKQAIETVDHYLDKGTESYYKEVNGKFFVYRKEDDKSLKSIFYSPAEIVVE